MAYCAASDIIEYGNFSTTDTPTVLAHLCTRAKSIIDSYCGRTFEVTSDTSASVRYYTETDDCDSNTLWLDKDLLVVGSDGIKAGQSSNTVTSTDYMLLPPNDPPYYAIRLRDNSPADWSAVDSNGDIEQAISIHGKWAYSSDCPADVKHACIRLVYWMYRQRETNADLDRPLLTGDGVTILPSRLPRDIEQILEPYRRKVVV